MFARSRQLLATLVLPGLTLGPLIRRLGIGSGRPAAPRVEGRNPSLYLSQSTISDLRGWEVGNREPPKGPVARVSNGIRYGLSSSIFTQDVNGAFRAMRDLKAGITYINAGTIGAEVHLPFGGTKATGNGHREAGTAALDVFSEWKSVYVDFSGRLQRAQIDT